MTEAFTCFALVQKLVRPLSTFPPRLIRVNVIDISSSYLGSVLSANVLRDVYRIIRLQERSNYYYIRIKIIHVRYMWDSGMVGKTIKARSFGS